MKHQDAQALGAVTGVVVRARSIMNLTSSARLQCRPGKVPRPARCAAAPQSRSVPR
jgi:hypothetical protein